MGGAVWPPRRARSVADAPAQGQNRATRLGGDLADQGHRLAPGPGPSEAGRQAHHLHAVGRRGQQRPVGPARDAQDRGGGPGRRRASSRTPPGTLPSNEGGSRRPSPVTTRSARSSRPARPTRPATRSNPGLYPGPEGGQPARQPPGRPGSGHPGHVDARLVAVARRHLGQAPAERVDLGGGGALLRPEHRGGVEERRASRRRPRPAPRRAGAPAIPPPRRRPARRRWSPSPRSRRRCGARPASRAASRSCPTPAVPARTGSSPRGRGSRARPAARAISITAVGPSSPPRPPACATRPRPAHRAGR